MSTIETARKNDLNVTAQYTNLAYSTNKKSLRRSIEKSVDNAMDSMDFGISYDVNFRETKLSNGEAVFNVDITANFLDVENESQYASRKNIVAYKLRKLCERRQNSSYLGTSRLFFY